MYQHDLRQSPEFQLSCSPRIHGIGPQATLHLFPLDCTWTCCLFNASLSCFLLLYDVLIFLMGKFEVGQLSFFQTSKRLTAPLIRWLSLPGLGVPTARWLWIAPRVAGKHAWVCHSCMETAERPTADLRAPIEQPKFCVPTGRPSIAKNCPLRGSKGRWRQKPASHLSDE